mgnify:CR=1 FL=1
MKHQLQRIAFTAVILAFYSVLVAMTFLGGF